MKIAYWYMNSPVGWLTLQQEADCLVSLRFGRWEAEEATLINTPLLQETQKQLSAYFAGKLRQFHLPLAPKGTAFQQKCWQVLQTIPYGSTFTYKQQAEAVGNPGAARAVGMANHCNPLPILIPCHRVVGANGKLTGYAGGLSIKEFLLELETNAFSGGGIPQEKA